MRDIDPVKVIYWLQRSRRVSRIFLDRVDWYPKRVSFVFICNSSIQVPITVEILYYDNLTNMKML